MTLAPLTTVADADRINDVIDRTWGGQRLDREVVRALAASGNVSWGATDGDRLVGFVLGWAGVDDAGLHVHSHMLASVPDSRHRGVGEALKLAQRAQALDQGIHLVRWTFDPLLARNAWLNVGKLGAVIDGFERAFYGAMQDVLNQGERSDRAFIAWDLRREPGPRRLPPVAPLPSFVTLKGNPRPKTPRSSRPCRSRSRASTPSSAPAIRRARIGGARPSPTRSSAASRRDSSAWPSIAIGPPTTSQR